MMFGNEDTDKGTKMVGRIACSGETVQGTRCAKVHGTLCSLALRRGTVVGLSSQHFAVATESTVKIRNECDRFVRRGERQGPLRTAISPKLR